MRFEKFASAGAALLSLAILGLPRVAAAGVTVVSRSSVVHVEGQGNADVFNDTKNSDQLGTFNDTATGQGGDVPDGTHARGTASQNSTIDATAGQVTGSGSLSTDAFAQLVAPNLEGPAIVTTSSSLTLLFSVLDNPAPFSISGAFDSTDNIGSTATVSLRTTGAPPATLDLFRDQNGPEDDLAFADTRTLQPGDYTLTLTSGSGSSGSGRGDPTSFGQNTGLSFDLSIGAAAPPPPPTAIPLPAGVWLGLSGLAAAAGVVRMSSRRRCALTA